MPGKSPELGSAKRRPRRFHIKASQLVQLAVAPLTSSHIKCLLREKVRNTITEAVNEQTKEFLRGLTHQYKRQTRRATNLKQGKKQTKESKAFAIVRENRERRNLKFHALMSKFSEISKAAQDTHTRNRIKVLADEIRMLGAQGRKNRMQLGHDGKDLEKIACEVERLTQESPETVDVEVKSRISGFAGEFGQDEVRSS